MLADVAIALRRWPIVGRRSELEVFERALGSGEHAGLVIHGRAGVGKTRLADECREQAAASGRPTERAPAGRLGRWLEVASQVPAFAGFAIGRSIWEDVVREYEASDYGDTAAGNARSKIAERYLGFVAHWTPPAPARP